MNKRKRNSDITLVEDKRERKNPDSPQATEIGSDPTMAMEEAEDQEGDAKFIKALLA